MVENTSKQDPAVHLVGLMGRGNDDYIMGMEAEGQRQVVAEPEAMPADGPWEQLQGLGFAPPEPTDDELFVRTRLPEGWAKQPTEHSMWSSVVDERGVERVAVFYKAAFYDRKAHCQIVNAGRRTATDMIYGDAAAGRPAQWGVLTEDERADYIASLDDYLERAAEHPDIYGDRVPRVQALKAAVT